MKKYKSINVRVTVTSGATLFVGLGAIVYQSSIVGVETSEIGIAIVQGALVEVVALVTNVRNDAL